MTVKTPDHVLYPIADALCMELHEVGDRIRGMQSSGIEVGPWTLPADIIVISDMATYAEAAVFVKIVGNLWLYIVSHINNNIPMKAYVFDGAIAKLHVKDCATFGGKSVEQTLDKLKAAVTTVYEFDEHAKKWTENVSYMDELFSAKNAIIALPGPEGISKSS